MTAFRLSVLLPALASVGLLAGSALAHAHPGVPGPQPDGMHGRPGSSLVRDSLSTCCSMPQ